MRIMVGEGKTSDVCAGYADELLSPDEGDIGKN